MVPLFLKGYNPGLVVLLTTFIIALVYGFDRRYDAGKAECQIKFTKAKNL